MKHLSNGHEAYGHLDSVRPVDADTIRAVYKGSNQDKLLELIEDGWTFTGEDVAEKPEAV